MPSELSKQNLRKWLQVRTRGGGEAGGGAHRPLIPSQSPISLILLPRNVCAQHPAPPLFVLDATPRETGLSCPFGAPTRAGHPRDTRGTPAGHPRDTRGTRCLLFPRIFALQAVAAREIPSFAKLWLGVCAGLSQAWKLGVRPVR